MVVVAVLLALACQSIAAARDARRYPPPGSFVDVDGCRLHVRGMGEGGPPVILEAGIAASSVGWAKVQPGVAAFTKVFAYDRAGLAWSGRPTRPRTVDQFLRELHAVVEHAGAPVILVGHSFGGLLVRLYAARHPENVVGLVLVDPALVHEWADPAPQRLRMLARGVSLSKRGAFLARLGIVRLGISLAAAGAKPIAQFVARASSGKGGSATTGRLAGEVSKLPREVLPVVQSHWSRPGGFLSMAEHLAALPAVAAEASRLPAPARAIVISGAHLKPDQLREHAALGDHRIAPGSGHWVHLDQPQLIVDAVREMLHR